MGEKGVKKRDRIWIDLNINPWVKKYLGYDVILFTEDKEIITSSLNFPIDKIDLDKNIKVSFIRIHDKLYLYALGPVFDDERKIFYKAYLIFAKEIDYSVLKMWENFIGGKITIIFSDHVDNRYLRNYYEPDSLHIEIPLEENILVHIDKYDNTIAYFYRLAIFLLIFFSFLTLLTSVIFSQILLNRVFSPFEKLVAISQEVAKGNYNVSIDYDKDDEIGQFMRTFKEMIAKIKEREEKLITEKKFAEEMMYIDPLTKVYNRRFLEENFEKIKEENKLFTLLFIDLDNFKEINDRYGHKMGDGILEEVANLFKKSFREKDLILRYGGDEFCVILYGTDSHISRKIVSQVYEEFKRKFYSSFEIEISFSYGLAEYPRDGESLDKLVEKADKEMYKYKI